MAAREATASQQTVEAKQEALAGASMPRMLKFLWGLVMAGLVISLSLWAYLSYYNMQEYCSTTLEVENVMVTLNSSAYLSVGDEEEVRVTVVNKRSAPVNILLKVVYTGMSLCLAGDDETHVMDFGLLQSEERATRKFKTSFPLCLKHLKAHNWPGQQVDFSLWLAVNDQPCQQIGTISLHTIPIPRAKMLGNVAGGLLAGLVIWSGKELWDRIKKMAEPPTSGKGRG